MATKLSDAEVRRILIDRGLDREVAARYGVREHTINRIRTGASRASVCPEIQRWRRYSAASTLEDALLERIDKQPGCWIWTGAMHNAGYGKLSFKGVEWTSHRAAYTAWCGPIPDGLHVLHSCDNKRCCNPAHLRAGTQADNRRDAMERGQTPRGEQHCFAKLTAQIVTEIRSSAATDRELARRYGVAQSSVSRARNRVNWRSIP